MDSCEELIPEYLSKISLPNFETAFFFFSLFSFLNGYHAVVSLNCFQSIGCVSFNYHRFHPWRC